MLKRNGERTDFPSISPQKKSRKTGLFDGNRAERAATLPRGVILPLHLRIRRKSRNDRIFSCPFPRRFR